MKILQILPELHSGGVERGTLEIASYLVQHGHESLVISYGGRLVELLEKQGSRHITMAVHKKRISSLLQISRLRALFLTEKPDIIHLRSRLPAWLAYLAWKSLPAASRPHFITTVHGFHSINAYSAIMTKGQQVICVSHAIHEHVIRDYHADPDKLHVIPRGVDPAHYNPSYTPSAVWLTEWKNQNPSLTNQPTLLLPGRITRLKGHEEFLHLIAALHQQGIPAHGLIAGDTHPHKREYLAELHALTQQLSLENHVTFLGHRSDLRDVIAISDITFSLSRQPEAFGRTALEAIALGKPVIGHAIGGIDEILTTCFPHGRVPLHDAPALLETARSILTNQQKPTPIPPAFTLAAMCASTLDLYKSVCS